MITITHILFPLFIGIIIGGIIGSNTAVWVTGIILLVLDIIIGIVLQYFKERNYSHRYYFQDKINFDDKEERQGKLCEEEEHRHKAEEAKKALLNIGDGYVTFGAYPQSIKASNVQIGQIYDSERGYYLGSDSCLYAEWQGNYYKVEPIKWKVLRRGGEIFVVADDILDAYCFDADSNNYADSEIRSWLNGDFYSKAFNDSQKAKIITTMVDNSPSSTGDRKNKYTCSNTNDKIFLLSRKEAEQYLNSDEARKRVPTEYAVARGAYQDTSNNNYYKRNGKGCGWWWLRSPCSPYYYDSGDTAQHVYVDGDFLWFSVDDSDVGVVPVLHFKP